MVTKHKPSFSVCLTLGPQTRMLQGPGRWHGRVKRATGFPGASGLCSSNKDELYLHNE
jgi:hypothetical protein